MLDATKNKKVLPITQKYIVKTSQKKEAENERLLKINEICRKTFRKIFL